MANFSEFLEIRVHNSYGDTFERKLDDPTCAEVVREFVNIAQQLGYPLGCIYEALLDEAESLKEQIRIAYECVNNIENEQ